MTSLAAREIVPCFEAVFVLWCQAVQKWGQCTGRRVPVVVAVALLAMPGWSHAMFSELHAFCSCFVFCILYFIMCDGKDPLNGYTLEELTSRHGEQYKTKNNNIRIRIVLVIN